MAEIKNTFIKSKMNKDLDDRLVPSGEYRNAQNVSISRSEGSDVGALENVLGNSLVEGIGLNINNLDVIGYLTDEANNNIYFFLTDYIDTSSGGDAFAPITSNCFIYVYNNTGSGNFTKLVQGNFLNFAKNFPITGVNLLEDLLFWTDNRNQPRKINVNKARPNSQSLEPTYYISEDTISVAKPAPISPIALVMKNTTEQYLPGYPVDPASPENPNYEANWAGDPNFLKDKFIRFSYRYKFDDGEYSLMAPFTQTCFIPKQYGYFLSGDQEEAYRSTVLQFLENSVTEIDLNILFESIDPSNKLHITDLEILYEESDTLPIKVIETISISTVESKMVGTVFTFKYLSTKPYKTLPADQTTRVYDAVPVKALTQEIASNRVIYGNFYDKMTPPAFVDYGVGYAIKELNSQIEYPNHTLKQNRNYQVGIVLADRFGRQSSVILSSRDANISEEDAGTLYGSSTIYTPYYDSDATPEGILAWPGYALRVLFNKPIESLKDSKTGEPGFYSETNPLGWYSYKIVVRQTEQDYYNVYLPSILNGYPTGTVDQGDIANIVLINDNINKVPRDLSEVGPDQRQYRSSVQLFGRVNPTATLNNQYYPGTNSDTVVSISTVADTNYNVSQGTNLVYPEFYQSETNPLIGRINTSKAIGVKNSNFNLTLGVYETSPVVSLLDIYWETSSTGLISVLNDAIDSGYAGPVSINLGPAGYIQNENMPIGFIPALPPNLSDTYNAEGKVVAGAFALNSSGIEINTNVNFSILSVIDGNSANRTDNFKLKQTDTNLFDIYTTQLFYYGNNDINDVNNRSFTFSIQCEYVLTGEIRVINFNGSLANTTASITNCPSNELLRNNQTNIFTLTGTNGMNAGGNTTQGLRWNIESASFNGTLLPVNQSLFAIDNNGVLTNPQGDADEEGSYIISVGLRDAAKTLSDPADDICNVPVTFGQQISISLGSSLLSTISENWNTVYNINGNQISQPLNGPAPDSKIYGPNITEVYATPEMVASVTNTTGALTSAAIYTFKENGIEVYREEQGVGFTGSVSYTFTNVLNNNTYQIDIAYGCVKYSISNTSGQGVVTYNFTNCDGTPGSGTVVEGPPDCICSLTVPTATGNYEIEANDPYCLDC